jgi:hypothetical protein
MNCPACNQPIDLDLALASDQELASERGRRNANKRKVHSGGKGRKSRKKRCPCGANTLKRAQARAFECCKKVGKNILD